MTLIIIIGLGVLFIIYYKSSNSNKRTTTTYYKKKSFNSRNQKPPQNQFQKYSKPAYTSYDDNKTKGDKFEKYIVQLFDTDSKRFKLINWRSDKIADNGMYAESNKYPDLEFAFIGDTNTYKFAIECKWRSSFIGGGVKWSEPRQIQNYLAFEKETKIKVFVAIGVGGTPEYPESLYVTPLQNIHSYPNVFETYLRQYKRKPNHKFFFNQHEQVLV